MVIIWTMQKKANSGDHIFYLTFRSNEQTPSGRLNWFYVHVKRLFYLFLP